MKQMGEDMTKTGIEKFDRESKLLYQDALNREIYNVEFKKDILIIKFSDDTGIILKDNELSCCEKRYLSCDDELSSFCYKTEKIFQVKYPIFYGIEINDVNTYADPSYNEKENDNHSVQFMKINTSEGTFTVCAHSKDHNGYYDKFDIQIRRFYW